MHLNSFASSLQTQIIIGLVFIQIEAAFVLSLPVNYASFIL